MDCVHDFFQEIKKELHQFVETNAEFVEDKKQLFHQAINQFNAATANITFGQYGGVMMDLNAIELPPSPDSPKFQPQFTMAPSEVHHSIEHLFGRDQANKCFKALCEEFKGEIKEIENNITFIRNDESKEISKVVQIGNARIKLVKHHRVDHNDHARKIQSKVHLFKDRLEKVRKASHKVTPVQRHGLLNKFDELCANTIKRENFIDSIHVFAPENSGRRFNLEKLAKNKKFNESLEMLWAYPVEEAKKKNDLKKRLQNRLLLATFSKRELMFLPTGLAKVLHPED